MASSRRLAAIMFTDMVGYTERTQRDERGTLQLLQEQEELVRPLAAAHHGRAVKSTGDGFLVEFPSALEATECAVDIQESLRQRNQRGGGVPIQLRIGIHLGDVEQRGDDIFGDAVNIAARVQPTADPGGIAISQQVFDQVRNKVDRPLERLEPKSLKGVEGPMELYRVVLTGPRPPTAALPAPSVENRIAVLPFSNISPDPRDAYLSDGLTEEVITVLSELGQLRVIARTSVEPYKSAPKPIPQVGAELGVGWVLEGSVRKAGNRVRITAQLIEVRSQEHVWSASYDRELDDVFALQSEMAKRVAEGLRVRLPAREAARLDRRQPPNPDSYLEYLQGRTLLHGIREADLQAARARFERAIELDEGNAAAHAGLSDAHLLLGGMYHHLPQPEWYDPSRRHAERAIEVDPDLAEAHSALATVLYGAGRFSEAEAEYRRAIALNPSFSMAHFFYGDLLADRGEADGALRELAIAGQLDPLSALVLAEEVDLLVMLGRLDRAETQLGKLGKSNGSASSTRTARPTSPSRGGTRIATAGASTG